MKLHEYVRNEYEAYTGELRADIWWANEGFQDALRNGLRHGLELTENDYVVFEQQGYNRAEVIELLLRATDTELAKTTGSLALLAAYAMREWQVDQSTAADLAYRIDSHLERWSEEIGEEEEID